MELKSSFRILFLIGFLVGLVQGECHPKDFGHGSPVCVCSETQKCTEGDFAHLKLDKAVINSIRSTKSGDRFVKKDYHFVKEDPKTAQALKLEINSAKKHQKILGFGGAMTDAAGYNIAKLPADLQKRLIGDYFGDDGLEYRVVRVPIGGSDFSPRMYSLDDNANDETLDKFALEKEDHEYKLPYLKMAQQLAGHKVKLFGSTWSSPKWMKTNNEFNHGGFLKGEAGGKYYQMFAHYLVKFLQAYAKENVTMWGLTVVNEPEFGADPHWGINVLGFSPAQQMDFVKLDLGPILAAAGFGPDKLKLMIHDDNVNKMNEMVNTVLSDPAAAKYVSGVAFHWYASGQSGQISSLDSLSSKFPSVFFLGTEACELHSVNLGEWQVAENYSRDIINDLNHNTGGWVEWNMVLDPTLKNHWADARMSASILVNSETKEYYKQPSYYALGHFSKLIPPESVRIDHKLSIDDQNTMATVFERPDGGKVATLLNRNAHAVSVEIHDPAHGFVSLELPAHSIESFVWY